MTKSREAVSSEDCWNVQSLYPNREAWNRDFQSLVDVEANNRPFWPNLAVFQGRLAEGPEVLKQALDIMMEIDRKLTKLYTYAHLRHDEDISNHENKKAYEKTLFYAHAYAEEIAWFEPELLALPDSQFDKYLHSPLLADYRFHLEKIHRIKKHTLSPENEKLMAMSGQALQTAHKAFSAINNVDFQFGSVVDSKGVERQITHASYGVFIRDRDRILRERVFKKYHHQFLSYQHTLGELLNGQAQTHLFNSRARHFSSCLEAALYPKNIETSVYHALIKAVNENLPVLHDYMLFRKEMLGVKDLHLYDLYVPLTEEVDIQMPYLQAEDVVIESVALLGSEYQSLLRNGFKKDRWVDRYENKNKRSGAYSSGCFDSMPYILMNYKEQLRDVFTLAHEAGHSMHSLFSRKSQPYHYSNYPIFLAEVASTFNEDLLTRYMLERCKDPQEKVFLLNQKLEDIRGTLFRQTMFAEFELFIHETAEKGLPLTPDFISAEYRKLNEKYFGSSLVIDEEIDIEWARIPHFYYNFYVFQYATGISAALALADRVVNGGKKEKEDYLNFLKSGSSRYPMEILKVAGIDMSTPAPVHAAIEKFRSTLKELKQAVEECKV